MKELKQLLLPHTRLPAQSSSASQSPSKIPQGWELEQHDHVSPDQSHPVKPAKSKNKNGENQHVCIFAMNYLENHKNLQISRAMLKSQKSPLFLNFSVSFGLIFVSPKSNSGN